MALDIGMITVAPRWILTRRHFHARDERQHPSSSTAREA